MGIPAKYKWFFTGIIFAIFWASASTATKLGLLSAQPLVIAVTRFGVAAFVMLCIAHVGLKQSLPTGKQWWQLTIYGLLNITIYLGCYVVAMQYVTAGIGTLAVGTNPVFISFFSVFFLKKPLTYNVVLALLICMAGIFCAAWPLLGGAVVTVKGLLILTASMLSYSIGAIYFSAKDWKGLSLFTINGWQTFIGGLCLVPIALYNYQSPKNHFDTNFWYCVLWLAIPVSLFAVQLWLWLLKTNTIKAGLWLFLCPLFGFAISAWLMKEPITNYTIVGVALVIGGLLVAQRDKKTMVKKT